MACGMSGSQVAAPGFTRLNEPKIFSRGQVFRPWRRLWMATGFFQTQTCRAGRPSTACARTDHDLLHRVVCKTKMNKNRRNAILQMPKAAAFTMVELLVVVACLAIL